MKAIIIRNGLGTIEVEAKHIEVRHQNGFVIVAAFDDLGATVPLRQVFVPAALITNLEVLG